MPVDHADALILIIDDNLADLELAREGLRASGLESRVRGLSGGPQALRYLESVLRYESPAPDLILLDINMPRINGFEVLRFIRSHDAFAEVPVFMFSTSIRECDVELAERMGANGYLGKPSDFSEYDEIAKRLVAFLPRDE